ncbi:ABC-2 transporter permease [Clostridium sp. B9]|uniref:ABC-2 transporter permease n=1 Tax=Clostridium sp. B9 TaxID=3423224 RepID=UPI003D2EA5AD
MKNLIALDFFIQKKFLKTLILVFAFLGISYGAIYGVEFLYPAGIFVVFYLMIIPIEYEKRNGFTKGIKSLPVKPIDYVGAKYITNLIYIFIVNVTLILISFVIAKTTGHNMGITSGIVLSTITVQLIYMAVTQPIYIAISYKYFRVVNIIFVIVSMFGSVGFFTGIQNMKLGFLFQKYTSLYCFIMGIIIFIISFIISLIIYGKKEER